MARKSCREGTVLHKGKCMPISKCEGMFLDDLVDFSNSMSGREVGKMFVKEGVDESIGEHLSTKFTDKNRNALTFYMYLDLENRRRFVSGFDKWRMKKR
jgi:hypothetical protein